MAITLNGTTGITTPDLSVDTNTLFVDAANNSVGVGTSSPVQTLHVNASSGNATLHLTTATSGATASDGFSFVSEATTNDAYVIQRENANLIFRTNNAERMRIDSAGRVTMPYQPTATVARTYGSYSSAAGTKFTYNETTVNLGNHMNLGTGRFTCPVAGIYEISLSAQAFYTGNVYIDAAIYINGNSQEPFGLNPIGGHEVSCRTMYALLSANDYIEAGISFSSASVTYEGRQALSVRLVG